jgi:hypothetical protein
MKNIHILPTDKPSYLYKNIIKGKFGFNKEWDIIPFGKIDEHIYIPFGRKSQHIYITSNEEIKEGDWYYYFGHIINYECDEHTLTPNCKKIILTTDQDLIKNGVQSIDDEFLEWFVKNPSCESVEIVIMNGGYDKSEDVPYQECYKIIIPKEEPKQLTDLEIAIKLEEIEREEPKQETTQGKYVIIDIRNMDFMKNEKDEINYYDTEEQARLVCGMYEFENAWVMKLIYNHIEP